MRATFVMVINKSLSTLSKSNFGIMKHIDLLKLLNPV